MAQQWEYLCTANAHDPATLTSHMNDMALAGWELLTVTFAIKGETGTHTLFWRRPPPASTQGRVATQGSRLASPRPLLAQQALGAKPRPLRPQQVPRA